MIQFHTLLHSYYQKSFELHTFNLIILTLAHTPTPTHTPTVQGCISMFLYSSTPRLLDMHLVESSVGYPKWLSNVLVGLDLQISFTTVCGHLHSYCWSRSPLHFLTELNHSSPTYLEKPFHCPCISPYLPEFLSKKQPNKSLFPHWSQFCYILTQRCCTDVFTMAILVFSGYIDTVA